MNLVLYSKPGCHLCDEMKAVIASVQRTLVASGFSRTVDVQEVDVSADADLMKQYGEQIPVLLLDGRKIAKYRIGEPELRRRLERRSA